MAGETTSTTVAAKYQGSLLPGLNAQTFTLTYATGQLELNDVYEAGYVPGPATVVGFLVKATDMDTNASPALAQKIPVGGPDLVTGVTAGQSGGQATYACVPTAITGPALISVTNTAAAATAAAGTLYVTVLSIA